MASPTASGKKKRNIPACIKEFIANLVEVFNKFCHKPKKKCSCQLKKVLQHFVQIGCPTQMNGIDCGLFAVMNCLHILDGVAINPSIFTQEHITRLQKVLPHVLGDEKNATRFYLCSILLCLRAATSQNLLSDVILKYSKHFPLAMSMVLLLVQVSEMMALDLWDMTSMKHNQIHLVVEANSNIYLSGMKLPHLLPHHQSYLTRNHMQRIICL